jgi:hypothetical protein
MQQYVYVYKSNKFVQKNTTHINYMAIIQQLDRMKMEKFLGERTLKNLYKKDLSVQCKDTVSELYLFYVIFTCL